MARSKKRSIQDLIREDVSTEQTSSRIQQRKKSLQDLISEDVSTEQPSKVRIQQKKTVQLNTRAEKINLDDGETKGKKKHKHNRVEKTKRDDGKKKQKQASENHQNVQTNHNLRHQPKTNPSNNYQRQQQLNTSNNHQQQQQNTTRKRKNIPDQVSILIQEEDNADHDISNSQHSESQYDGSEEDATETNYGEANDQNIASSSKKPRGRKKRGYTLMLHIWGRPAHLPRLEVEFNEEGKPVGKSGHTFSEFLGTVARNHQYCPIDVEDWRKMAVDNKNDMLDIIKARFDITLADESYILKSIGTKWRSWKSHLKANYWSPNLQEYNIPAHEPRVCHSQWLNILTYWNKEETVERSNKNKEARANKTLNQTTGKTSYASVSHKKEKETGKKPSRANMFKLCYIRKDKKKTPEEVMKAVNDIEVLQGNLPEGEEDPIAPDDIFAQVRGPDKPGYVRMVGSNISPAEVWGDLPQRKSAKRIMIQQRRELAEKENVIADLRAQLSVQQNGVFNNHQNTTSVAAHQDVEIEVGAYVCLKSVVETSKIVAEGYIESKDTSKIVGNKALGAGWYEIMVMDAVYPEEDLIRMHDGYETVGQVIGTTIAWPMTLITRAEHI